MNGRGRLLVHKQKLNDLNRRRFMNAGDVVNPSDNIEAIDTSSTLHKCPSSPYSERREGFSIISWLEYLISGQEEK